MASASQSRAGYRASGKRTRAGGRLRGVDVARTVAVAGMVMVHFGPYPLPDTLAGSLYGITGGRASVLFALLAGIGVTLLTGRRKEPVADDTQDPQASRKARKASARGRLALRGVLLLPLGLWLQQLDHGALVILQYYAAYFLLAALVLGLPDRRLLEGAAVALVLGPLIYLLGQAAVPEWYTALPATLGDPATKITHDLLLSGAYPLVTWSAPLLFGIWLGRTDLGDPAVHRRLLVFGAAVSLASALVSTLATTTLPAARETLTFLLSDEPHGQATLWMAGSIGSACAVLGGALMLTGGAGRSPRSLQPAWPLVATGQMALSVYVTHLLLLHSTGSLLDREAVLPALIAVAAFMAAAIALCTAWRAAFERGPLEAMLALPWWTVQRLIPARSYGDKRRNPETGHNSPDRNR